MTTIEIVAKALFDLFFLGQRFYLENEYSNEIKVDLSSETNAFPGASSTGSYFIPTLVES